jgi:hypothetical protein
MYQRYTVAAPIDDVEELLYEAEYMISLPERDGLDPQPELSLPLLRVGPAIGPRKSRQYPVTLPDAPCAIGIKLAQTTGGTEVAFWLPDGTDEPSPQPHGWPAWWTMSHHQIFGLLMLRLLRPPQGPAPRSAVPVNQPPAEAVSLKQVAADILDKQQQGLRPYQKGIARERGYSYSALRKTLSELRQERAQSQDADERRNGRG